MKAEKITRSGSDMTKTFHLVVDGEKELSTPIYKVETKEEFRMLGPGNRVPMEQYGFRVHGRKDVVERFADAAAFVLKKHKVTMTQEDLAEAQIYVKRAFALISGKEQFRLVPNEKVGELKFQPGEAFDETRLSLEEALEEAFTTNAVIDEQQADLKELAAEQAS